MCVCIDNRTRYLVTYSSETRVEIGRDRRTAQSQVSGLFVGRGKIMISARTKMESLMESFVQDSRSTGREEASSAFDSGLLSLSQSELASPNTMVVSSCEDGSSLLSILYQF